MRFSRTELLLGKSGIEKLHAARIAVFGVGGVGSYAAEALARSGVGNIDLIDSDRVAKSNINRQIIALDSTIGKFKTEVMKERILDINPDCRVEEYRVFYLPGNKEQFDFSQYSYIIDAVDTVAAKVDLAIEAELAGVPIISSMGAGNKLDPLGFEVGDIYTTSVCPLAKVMRRELKKRGIKALKVVYSKEKPVHQAADADGKEEIPKGSARRSLPGSVAYIPSIVGLIIASEVVREMIK